MITQSDLVCVQRVQGKGRGVFARQPIPRGTIIEQVPVVVVPSQEVWNVASSRLSDYVFVWGDRTVAIALGYGSLYNHSYEPNARYDPAPPRKKLFTALRDIEPGEEITINYNGHPRDRSPVGFDVV